MLFKSGLLETRSKQVGFVQLPGRCGGVRGVSASREARSKGLCGPSTYTLQSDHLGFSGRWEAPGSPKKALPP